MGTILKEYVGSKGNIYNITLGADGVTYCTCPAWKFSGKNRTCKHLEMWKSSTPAIKQVGVGLPIKVTVVHAWEDNIVDGINTGRWV